jgi:peptidyl-prolyl cis-trans isomerase D
MVMMISRFHRLIQSRVLWAAILVIVVFSFVIWGMRTPSAARRAAEANAAGKLDGKLVSREAFMRAYFNTYMSAALSVGRTFDITAKLDAQIRESAWRRYAALQEAEKLGIRTSDEEVQATIQSHPGFHVNDRFSEQAYAAFVQNVLARMGFSAAQFEEHVREEITLQKLQRSLQNAVLVPPLDITRTFRSLMDTFTVDYVILTPSNVESEVSVSRDDAYVLYQSDPAAFKIPPRVTVKYVEIPAARFLQESAVTNETDALAYYDEHIDEYTVTNVVPIATDSQETNVVAASLAATTTKVETLSFDLVKTNIMEIMTRRAALEKAADLATEFVVALAPDREGHAPSFEDTANVYGLQIKKLAPFSASDDLPEIEVPDLFKSAAFALRPNPEEYVSEAVTGSNTVYVIAIEKQEPERIPAFEEVEESAMKRARENAIEQALTKKAEQFRDEAAVAVKSGKKLADVAASYGLKVKQIKDFTLSAEDQTNAPPAMLIRGILPRNQGEITDLLKTEDGVIIGHIVERKPGDVSTMASLAPQIRETIRQQRGKMLFRDWQEYLLKQRGFEDLSPQQKTAMDAQTDEGEAAEEEQPEEKTQAVPAHAAPEDGE